jgi:magnesium-transporting ATPase (P-type)
MKTDIEEAISNMASTALRTIAIAYRPVKDGEGFNFVYFRFGNQR